MPRYIDAEELTEHKYSSVELTEHKFSSVSHERFVSDVRPKSKKEIYAYKVGYNDAIDSIVNFAPTADVVEQKRGKWRLNKEGNWACPFCEFDPYHDEMNGMNYCPNCGARLEMPIAGCGARMEEDDEESTKRTD